MIPNREKLDLSYKGVVGIECVYTAAKGSQLSAFRRNVCVKASGANIAVDIYRHNKQ